MTHQSSLHRYEITGKRKGGKLSSVIVSAPSLPEAIKLGTRKLGAGPWEAFRFRLVERGKGQHATRATPKAERDRGL
jgi:hypothetical protein